MGSNISLGDTVEWTSQAGGYTRKKRGTVVEVVPPCALPDVKFRVDSTGLSRRSESYVVHASHDGRGGARNYWPIASKLTKVEPDTQPAA